MRKLGTYLATAIIILFFISPSVLLVAGDAILTWNPNTDAVAGYKVYYGTVSHTYGSPIDVGNQTTYTVAGLSAGTYYFAVTAYNSSQNESGFSNEVSKTITVADTTPPTISATTASSITQTGATITWTTNEASDTQVDYGTTTAYGSSTTLNTSLVTSHTATLSGLTANTQYHYRVKSKDAAGNLATSSDLNFTTAADTTPPVLSAISASSITQSGATISWTTNEASDSRVDYGTTASYGSSVIMNTSLVTSHNVTLSGLTASTLYHYRVGSLDAATNLAISGDFTFTTAADTTPPLISAVSASSITQSGATINWTTNEVSDTQVEYGTTTGYGSSTTLNTSPITVHSAALAGLNASTLYHYRVKSKDTAGNLATSLDFTFTTAADTTPPLISAVSASSITQITATISWSTNEVSDTQVEYGTTTGYGSSTALNTSLVTSHTATLSGLTANTQYHYRVKSRDAAGNLATSSDINFNTAADTTPPVFSAVSASSITQSGATIGWTTDEASDTQVDYGPTASYGSSTTLNTSLVTSHSATLSGLTASTVYHYRVRSRDAASNLAISTDFTFTTAADTTAPVISGTAASQITQSGATIGWTTNEASDTQVEYGSTTAYGSSTTLNTSLVTAHSAPVSGLTASTLYHYRVKSKDAAGNLATSGDFTFTTAADTTPPTISATTASSITQTGATITWTTNEASDTQVDYGTTTGYGSSTTLNTSLVTSHTATLSGLTANTQYHYRVKSRDAAGNLATSSDINFNTAADTTPPVFSAVSASSITQSGATIGWTTDEASDTQVDYGSTASYGSSTTLNSSLVTSHSAVLNGLTASSLYHYRVKSKDVAGNLATSGDFTFTTAADTTAPVISGTAASPVTQSGATITWTTNEASDTQVEYGTTAGYGSSTTLNTSLVTSHSAVLSGLTASSLYHYRVKSKDAAGNLATSGDFTFTTAADTTAPVVSAISASSITLNGATISWTTNEASDTQVDYGTTAGYGSSTTLNTSLVTSHAATLSGLTASTVYHYRVKSRDAAGNLATSGDFTLTTAADAIPPTMPTGLSANAASSTQINLSWTASTDNVSVTGYKIFRNSSQITTTAGTSFQDTGLNPSTSYSYTISAYDAAGNNSASSTAASATTQAPPDTTPPVISAVGAAPITSTGATVNWTTDEAADSQVEYGTTTAYGSSTTLDGNRATTHSQLVSGLTSATPYHYRVRSRDAAGNLALSGDFTFTTLSLCDVNGDGGINAIDLQAVINAILSGTNPAKLDINQDGAVDVLDLQILNNVILGVRTCPT